MKASELKSALDPHIKRASQNTVNKIKEDIKKKNKANTMPAAKKEEVRYVKASTFDGLKEIVEMKKQKAVANELDSLIYEQENAKNKRNTNMSETKTQENKKPSPLEIYLAANPEKIKDMSMEEITKLSMLMNNNSGGSDPLMSMLLMNMNKKGNNGGDLQTKLLGMLMEKLIKGNNGDDNKSGGEMEMVKLMMQQNMQTQNLMMNMIMKKDEAPPEEKNNLFMKELFGMVKGQTDFENSFLRDKIQNLEMRQNSNDPLGEAKRMMDYIKTFKGFFGDGGNITPESMQHEIKLKELNFEQARQVNEDSRRASNMEQIGSMINNTIETFGKVLGEPIAEAAKSKIEKYTENAQNPPAQKVRISPEQYQEEIDLGDLENLEADVEAFEGQKPKNTRFKVYETAE